MWLLQAARGADGELPYRDFAWIHPPLSILLFSSLFRWCGATFLVANAGLVFLSLTATLLFYLVAQKVAGARLGWTLTLVFCVCESYMQILFRLRLYIPAQLTGMNGVLLVLLGALGWLESKQRRWLWSLVLFGGSFVSLLSKLEFVAGLGGCLLALSAVDGVRDPMHFSGRWFRRQAVRFLAAVSPAFLFCIWLGRRVGFADLWQGLQGYGLASAACPWWPHGIGLLGILGGLGEAIFILAALSLVRARVYHERPGHLLLGVTAVGGLLVWASYFYVIREDILTFSTLPLVWGFIDYLVHLDMLLFPVMCLGVVALPLVVFLSIRDARRGVAWNRDWLRLLVLLGTASAMSMRGIFGDWNLVMPHVCDASRPVWLLVGALLLRLTLSPKFSRGEDAVPPPDVIDKALTIGTVCYAAAFLIGFSAAESRRSYPSLMTRAGEVRIQDYAQAAPLYQLVASRLPPGSSFLEVPAGAGLTFALRLKRPIYREEEVVEPIPQRFLERDESRFRNC